MFECLVKAESVEHGAESIVGEGVFELAPTVRAVAQLFVLGEGQRGLTAHNCVEPVHIGQDILIRPAHVEGIFQTVFIHRQQTLKLDWCLFPMH